MSLEYHPHAFPGQMHASDEIADEDDRTRQTCREMFELRGYSDIQETLHELHATTSDDKHVMLCWLRPETKMNVVFMKQYYTHFRLNNVDHGILVYHGAITASVRRIVETINDMYLELFARQSLHHNITRHVLVPRHERISRTEHPEAGKYPVIRKTDPIVRFYDFRVGDLIRIHRLDGIYFRIVR